MRGVIIQVGILAAILIGAFIGAVAVLNATVYSPAGFVSTYVDALARKDPAAALGLAGPNPSSSAIDDLLTAEIMTDFEVIRLAEVETTGPRHAVEVVYTAEGRESRAVFDVEQAGTVLGLFSEWSFARTPLIQLELRVLHTQEFLANGVRQVAPEAGASRRYLAFTPGAITFDHESSLMTTVERTLTFGSPARSVRHTIAPVANEAFVDLVHGAAADYLDGCAEQQVLYPVRCPFGLDIADRLAGPPLWSIVEYPAVSLTPTATIGEWAVPVTAGVAHIDAEVRSIYDGSVSGLSSTVDFRVGYVVTLVGEEIVVTPRLG